MVVFNWNIYPFRNTKLVLFDSNINMFLNVILRVQIQNYYWYPCFLILRDKAPGQKECDDAIEKLSSRIRDLDQTSLAAVSQSLPARRDNTLQGFTDQMESSANEIAEKLEPVRAAAKYEAENIGHAVSQRPVSSVICMQLFVVYKHRKLWDRYSGTDYVIRKCIKYLVKTQLYIVQRYWLCNQKMY